MTPTHNDARTSCISMPCLFLQKVPLPVIMNRIVKIDNWPLPDAQQLVASIFSENSQYLPYEWLKNVLKQIVIILESFDSEISDEITELMMTFSRPVLTDDDKSGYVIYSGRSTILQGKAFVHTVNLHNQVGMKVWSAGLFCAELLLAAPHLSVSKHIVELGAGTGCTSLIAALSYAPPCRITLTDFHEEVLDNLRSNADKTISENALSLCDIRCHRVDWIECQRLNEITCIPLRESLQNASDRLLILAADCLYAEDLASPLLATISLLLHSSTGGDNTEYKARSGVALIATMVRNPDTYAHVESCFENLSDLCCRDITSWAFGMCDHIEPLFYYDSKENIRVVCVALRDTDIDEFMTGRKDDSQ